MQINGNATSDMQLIVQHFNNYFCTVGTDLAATINSDRDIHKFGTLPSIQSSLFLRPASLNETLILINALDAKKSPSPDGIPGSFIKNNHIFFGRLLADVFNEIVVTGEYPAALKVARVTPVFKSGNAKEVNNYRPISCLSILDKIIEKMIVTRLVDFMDQHNLLYEHQYGFRQGFSTLSASSDLVDDIYDSLDIRKIVGALFIDLKKAFDTIDHRLLVEKLEYYGIRGIAKSLLTNYLSDRRQYVSIGKHHSTLQQISIGVPQGSNLGPILFLLFINDLAKLNLNGKLRLFADDTSVFYHGTDCSSIQQLIQQDLEALSNYCRTNLLSMNLTKTKYMLIHSSRKILPIRSPIKLNSHVIEEVFQFPFLGLVLDSTMSWKAHIDSLKKKLSSLCGLLWKLSSFLPTTCLKKIYFSLVQSRLNYLVTNWGLACLSNLRELQVLQNRCIKAVFRKPFLFPTRQLYENTNDSFLPIRALQEVQMLLHIRKCTSNPNLNGMFPTRGLQHGRATRQLGHFVLPRTNSEFGKKKVSYVGCKTYNSLPPACKNAANLNIFKRTLRTHIKSKIPQYLI